jgi:hypothetical protein
MLFDGTFGVWFPTAQLESSAISIRHKFLQILWLSFSQGFLSLVRESIVPVEGEKYVSAREGE